MTSKEELNKELKNINITVDDIETIIMDNGSYEHPIEKLDGELIMSDDEITSAVQAIYDYVIKNIK